MDWIDVVQDRDQWKAVVKTVKEPSVFVNCWEVLFLLLFIFNCKWVFTRWQ
jgi:hypothetical protein